MRETPSQFRKKYNPLVDVDLLEWLDEKKEREAKKTRKVRFWLDMAWYVAFWASLLISIFLLRLAFA